MRLTLFLFLFIIDKNSYKILEITIKILYNIKVEKTWKVNSMKKKILKVSVLVAILTVCIASIVAISVSAAKPIVQTAAKITDANLVMSGKIQIAFSVTETIVMPEGGVAGIMVWDSSITEPEIENCLYVNFNQKAYKTVNYYKTREIDVSDFGREFYVAACYKYNDEIRLGENPFKYSPMTYLTKRVGEIISSDQCDVYSSLIDLYLSSGAVDEFSAIRTVGGFVGLCEATFGGAKGQEVIIRADAKNANDEYFLGWADDSGAIISNERLLTVKNDTDKIVTYTAVYGDGAESLYSSTYNFEALELGAVDFNVPSQYTGYTNKGYNSARTPVWSVSNSSLPSLSIGYYVEAVHVGDGNYVYGKSDYFEVTEGAFEGDRELYMYKGHQIIGYSATFKNNFEDSFSDGCEVDIKFLTLVTGGMSSYVNITLTDANGVSIALRTNLSYSTSAKTMTMYAEPTTAAERVTASVGTLIRPGEIYSFRGELDRENLSIRLYANGVLVEDMPLSAYTGYQAKADTFDVSTCYVTSMAVNTISSSKDHVTIDNLTFLRGEEIIIPDVEGDTEGEEVVE